MNAPLRSALFIMGAVTLAGLGIMNTAGASSGSTGSLADLELGHKDGGAVELGHKEGGAVELGHKEGGAVELVQLMAQGDKSGKDGGAVAVEKSDAK